MPSAPKKNILIIGYGNTLRGDDGIGQIIVEKIEKLHFEGVDLLALQQLTPDLASKISEYRTVFFIDASKDIELNEIQVISLKDSLSQAQIEHAMSPEDLLKLSEELYSYSPQSFCILIPARNFSFSDELSVKTQSMIEPAINIITAKIKNIN